MVQNNADENFSRNRTKQGGEGQRWFADRYARNARFVADLGAPLLDMLAPRAGERILDLGCGDGALTLRIAEAGAEVVAVDSAADEISTARALGLDAHVMDGHALKFDAEFDGILTNAALHWMTRPDAVIDGMWRALRSGGRLVGEMGGAGNVATIFNAMVDAMAQRGVKGRAVSPWYFPTPEDYRARLEAAGFEVEAIELIPRPTVLPGKMEAWLETFGEAFLHAMPEEDRPAILAEITEAVRPALFEPEGRWVADYVRLRFRARKPEAA